MNDGPIGLYADISKEQTMLSVTDAFTATGCISFFSLRSLLQPETDQAKTVTGCDLSVSAQYSYKGVRDR
jgi:hypothetical protein